MNGKTPLQLANENGHMMIVALLKKSIYKDRINSSTSIAHNDYDLNLHMTSPSDSIERTDATTVNQPVQSLKKEKDQASILITDIVITPEPDAWLPTSAISTSIKTTEPIASLPPLATGSPLTMQDLQVDDHSAQQTAQPEQENISDERMMTSLLPLRCSESVGETKSVSSWEIASNAGMPVLSGVKNHETSSYASSFDLLSLGESNRHPSQSQLNSNIGFTSIGLDSETSYGSIPFPPMHEDTCLSAAEFASTTTFGVGSCEETRNIRADMFAADIFSWMLSRTSRFTSLFSSRWVNLTSSMSFSRN